MSERKRVQHNTPFVFHYRTGKEKGGLTVVFDPVSRLYGVAVCSKKDNYNKKMGVRIATGRIEKAKKNLAPVECSRFVRCHPKDDLFIDDVKHIADDIAGPYLKSTNRIAQLTILARSGNNRAARELVKEFCSTTRVY